MTFSTPQAQKSDNNLLMRDAELPSHGWTCPAPLGSSGRRSRSASPTKRRADRPIRIRMNPTGDQVDNITDAFAHNQIAGVEEALRSSSKIPLLSLVGDGVPVSDKMNGLSRLGDDNSLRDFVGDGSPAPRNRSQRSSSPSLACRRRRAPPAPLRIEETRKFGALIPGGLGPASVHPQAPISAESSLYSQDEFEVSPPRPQGGLEENQVGNGGAPQSVLEHYDEWRDAKQAPPPTPPPRPVVPPRGRSLTGPHSVKSTVDLAATAQMPEPEALYSPLTPYFANKDFPTVKKGAKVLIGDNGWLQKTGTGLQNGVNVPTKRPGLLNSLKKMAREMTMDVKAPKRLPEPRSHRKGVPHIVISLDPREQSLASCELEFHIHCALQDYIAAQLNHGRVDYDKLKKIADFWHQQGRPRVVGFRYDVETQVDLVRLHLEEFRFYGRRQGNPAEIDGLLQAVKTNARAMRIRTFCQPDSVIAKQIADSQALFELLGVPESRHMSLEGISQFFQVVVQREHASQMTQAVGGGRNFPRGGKVGVMGAGEALSRQSCEQARRSRTAGIPAENVGFDERFGE